MWCILDPYDTERPLGMNMLEANTEEQKHFCIQRDYQFDVQALRSA